MIPLTHLATWVPPRPRGAELSPLGPAFFARENYASTSRDRTVRER